MTDEIVQFGEREISELADMIRYYRKNGLWSPGGSSGVDNNREAGLLIKNTESSVIPAYGCMEVIGTVDETQNYIRVKKPTSTGTLFLFNGHYEIEASGYGTAQTGPVYRVYKNSGTVTFRRRWKPTVGQYYLSAGLGPWVVYGEDDIATNVFRVVENNRVEHVKTKSSCTGRDDSTGAMSSVSCDLYEVAADGTVTDTTIDEDLWNPGGDIDSGKWGTAVMNGAGKWEFVVVKCS